MAHTLYIGTSGWSYPRGAGTWDGIFYPPKLADRDKLAFYAQYFNTVEINSSFYRPPTAAAAAHWAQRVPADFRFTAKLWQKFTHPKMFEESTGGDTTVTKEDFDLFLAGLDPLAKAGKLGPLLAQFPTSFRPHPQPLDYLEDLIRHLSAAGYRLAVELRHREWTESEEAASVRALMEAERVAWTIIDEPRFRTSIRDVPLTSDVAYFRFHGRNYQQWWRHDASEDRYNYLYSMDQQRMIAEEVDEVAHDVRETYAFYNNHYGAKAPANAFELKRMLGEPLPHVPLPDSMLSNFPELSSTPQLPTADT